MSERPRTLPDLEALMADQTRVLENFFGHEAMPKPPKTLVEFVERTTELGFTFEPYFEPHVVFTKDSSYPGLVVRPNPWLFALIKTGEISLDAASLSGQWAAMEGFQKPEYDYGKQLYENDPLAPELEMLRKNGKIVVPDPCRHIPSISRFGTSPDEIASLIVPVFAELSQIEELIKAGKIKAGVSPYAAWFYRGNNAHPEWGQTNTWEWLADHLGTGRRLIGGHRDYGGLARISYAWHNGHGDGIGFRLRVVFSS